MMVLCHVDDLKLSHVKSFEITKFAGYLSSIYGGITVHRGKVNDFLGMDLDYIEQATVKLSMIKYLDSVLQEFPEHFGMTAVTPEFDYLFNVRNESKTQYLPE